MSTILHTQDHKKKSQTAKAVPQIKDETKRQPVGMSREEIRQIVLEMIG